MEATEQEPSSRDNSLLEENIRLQKRIEWLEQRYNDLFNIQKSLSDVLTTLKDFRPALNKSQTTALSKYSIIGLNSLGWRPSDIEKLIVKQYNLCSKRYIFKILKQLKNGEIK